MAAVLEASPPRLTLTPSGVSGIKSTPVPLSLIAPSGSLVAVADSTAFCSPSPGLCREMSEATWTHSLRYHNLNASAKAFTKKASIALMSLAVVVKTRTVKVGGTPSAQQGQVNDLDCFASSCPLSDTSQQVRQNQCMHERENRSVFSVFSHFRQPMEKPSGLSAAESLQSE